MKRYSVILVSLVSLLLVLALVLTALSELAFTLYLGVEDLANMIGQKPAGFG